MKIIPKKRIREDTYIAILDAREIAVLHALLSFTDPNALSNTYERLPEQYRSKITGFDFEMDIPHLQSKLRKVVEHYDLFA